MFRLLLLMLIFYSCSNDDDQSPENCYDCESIIDGQVGAEYCDNGNGTVNIIRGNTSNTVSIHPFSTFEEYIENLDLFECQKK